MKNYKSNKAITLIALIITIVVLLILAVVAINSIQEGGILAHAKSARQTYKDAVDKESGVLSYYTEYLASNGDMGPWVQSGDSISMKNIEGKTVELKIGDIVNYDSTNENTIKKEFTATEDKTGILESQTFTNNYNGRWKVLGTENGKILLVSADDIISDLKIAYDKIHINGSEQLNNISSIYGYGKGAESARCIKVEDINRITGYDPGTMTKGNKGKLDEYGNVIIITSDGTTITYTSTNGTTGTYEYSKFWYIKDGEFAKLEKGETVSIKINYFDYDASKEATISTENMKMEPSSEKYKMLFRNDADTEDAHYFTASKGNFISSKYNNLIYYTLFGIADCGVGTLVGICGPNSNQHVISTRAVVKLLPDTKLVKEGNFWNIK